MTNVPRGPNAQPPADYREEFTHIYRELEPIIHRYIVFQYPKLGADVVDVIVSDVFLKAWGHWAKVRLMPDPIPWFITTAKTAAIDYWRRTNRDTPVEVNENDAALIARVTDPETRLELLDSLKAMSELPERMREALAQWCAGWSQHEIATAMSLQETTISEYVNKARDRVARAVGRPRPRRRGRHRAVPPEHPHRRDDRPDREDQQ